MLHNDGQHCEDDGEHCEGGKISAETAPEQVPEGSATIASTVFCMTNNMLGAGLLTLPYAMYRGSMIGGVVLLTAICGMSAYTVMLLARCSDMTGSFSYKALAVAAFGPRWGKLVESLICLLTFGSCVAYATLVGDFLPKVRYTFVAQATMFACT